MQQKADEIINVRLREDDQAVVIVDQTRLPNRLEYLELSRADQIGRAHV